MKQLSIIVLTTLCLSSSLFAQQKPSIIPQPVRMEMSEGFFQVDKQTSLKFNAADPQVKSVMQYFTNRVKELSGIALLQNAGGGKQIRFSIDKNSSSSSEGYVLDVQKNAIDVKAEDSKGFFYAIQSLLQTFPQVRTNAILQVPCMHVEDEPRFKWRGMMLDVSRHFAPIETVKEYIDLMAMYKLNTLHWHLTDDPGWRIEIKKYPKLTQVGAWRVDQNDKIWGSRPQAKPGETPTYGGFYTQDELKEVVKYAQLRNVTIVPEIEMPGHSAAAVASYPWLSCKQIPQLPMTGGNYTNMASNYCAGNDSVFTFLQDVLKEVMAIFPSTYIHVGGDEVDKGPWKQCAKCQSRMKANGLKTEEELQSYLITRMEKFINKNHRRMIGWDEILEGGLAPEATVMSWRGEAGGIEAAKMNHNVVMTPGTPLYFDHYQAGPEGEPLAFGGFNTLKMVYDYNAYPKELPADKQQFVLGAQANLWTEMISTRAGIEYMVLPRMLALGETLWTPAEKKNWIDFTQRIKYHYRGFELKGYNYSKGNFAVDINPVSKDGKLWVELKIEDPELEIRYTTDGSFPTANSLKYEAPVSINSSVVVKAVAVKYGRVMSNQPAEQIVVMHKGVGSNVQYAFKPANSYMAAGMNSLTDGIRGKSALNKSWHGFESNDLIATIDLGKSTSIHKLSIGCLQQYGSWIFLPSDVVFEVSTDGVNFTKVSVVKNDVDVNSRENIIKEFSSKINADNVRYVRVTAHSVKTCPAGHPGEGKNAWLFADEIVVE